MSLKWYVLSPHRKLYPAAWEEGAETPLENSVTFVFYFLVISITLFPNLKYKKKKKKKKRKKKKRKDMV